MSHDLTLVPGDLLRIERRHLVDGVPTTTTDQGRFAGVQVVGSAEHLALRAATGGEVRLFPLHTISEITLVKPKRRAKKATSAAGPGAARPEWDPGVA